MKCLSKYICFGLGSYEVYVVRYVYGYLVATLRLLLFPIKVPLPSPLNLGSQRTWPDLDENNFPAFDPFALGFLNPPPPTLILPFNNNDASELLDTPAKTLSPLPTNFGEP